MRRNEAERAVALLREQGPALGITEPMAYKPLPGGGYRARLIVSANLDASPRYIDVLKTLERGAPWYADWWEAEGCSDILEWQTWAAFTSWAATFGVMAGARDDEHPT